MCQAEHVDLFKGRSGLRGQAEEASPVLGQLGIVDGEVQLESLLDLPFFPTGEKSEKEFVVIRLSQIASSFFFYTMQA